MRKKQRHTAQTRLSSSHPKLVPLAMALCTAPSCPELWWLLSWCTSPNTEPVAQEQGWVLFFFVPLPPGKLPHLWSGCVIHPHRRGLLLVYVAYSILTMEIFPGRVVPSPGLGAVVWRWLGKVFHGGMGERTVRERRLLLSPWTEVQGEGREMEVVT